MVYWHNTTRLLFGRAWYGCEQLWRRITPSAIMRRLAAFAHERLGVCTSRESRSDAYGNGTVESCFSPSEYAFMTRHRLASQRRGLAVLCYIDRGYET